MKSKYFKNLAKGLVVAGAAFALVNCGDAADQVNNAVAEPSNSTRISNRAVAWPLIRLKIPHRR